MTTEPKSGLIVFPLPVSIAIVIVASLCFSNSYNGDFAFDDSEAIVNNEDVKTTPILQVFKNDFWGTKLSHKQSHKSYRPLTTLSFRLHHWMKNNLNPQDFHIVNIILHTSVCILTLFVFDILLDRKSPQISFYASTLFAVHPVHAEAVSGIVGRADVLCGLFVWLAIILYHCGIQSRYVSIKLSYFFLCTICITIAMLCKEIGITAIGLCAVYDVVVVNKFLPADILHVCKPNQSLASFIKLKCDLVSRLVFLSLTAVLLLLLRFSIMGFSAPVFKPVDNPASFLDSFIFRWVNYNYIYCLNIWLLLCPEWLCFDWSMGCVPLILGFDTRIIFIILLWIILGMFFKIVFSRIHSGRVRCTTMGMALLLIPFIPASNLFFNVGFVLAERTLYIPSAGYCFLLAIGLSKLSKKVSSPKILSLVYWFYVTILFSRSWMRSEEWRTEKTLFQSAIKVCPLNAKVHYNIAKNAADDGNITFAQLEYYEALRLNPDYAQAMNNLGNLLKDQSEYEKAEKLLKRAVELQENFAAAWMNLGIVLSALDKFDESEKSYLTALAYRSKYPDCYYNLGLLHLTRKHYNEALKAWEDATRQNPTHRRAWTNTILLLDDLGNQDKALIAVNRALELLPNDATIHFNAGNVFGKSGKFAEAEKHFRIAIAQDHLNPVYFTNLGVLYHRWKRFIEAEQMYKRALEIDANSKSAKENLRKLRVMRNKV